MALETLIKAALDNDSAVTAQVGTRITNEVLKQNGAFPALVFTIFLEPDQVLEGRETRERALVVVDIYAEDLTTKLTIRELVITALTGASTFTARFDDHKPITYDESIPIYRESLHFDTYYSV